MKYYVINVPFIDWTIHFKNNHNITYVDSINSIDFTENCKIIPICPNDFIRHNMIKLLFYTDLYNISILNNKGLFAKFMMENFKDYIPLTIYYNVNNKLIYNSKITSPIMILKSTMGAGGMNVKIIKDSDFPKNIEECKIIKNFVVSEYIKHSILYVAHFLIIKGILIDKIYFYLEIKSDTIYQGRVKNYKVCEQLPYNDNIFTKIFNKLNYSGFACIDFTILNNKIYIFEINPRIGGSLVFNIIYFHRFFFKLVKYYDENNLHIIKN